MQHRVDCSELLSSFKLYYLNQSYWIVDCAKQ
jgi:hypothetical protein